MSAARGRISWCSLALGRVSESDRVVVAAHTTFSAAGSLSQTGAGLAVTGAILPAGTAFENVSDVTDTSLGRVIGVAGPMRISSAAPEAVLYTLGDSVAAVIARRFVPSTR